MNKYTRTIESQLLKNKLDSIAKLLRETSADSSIYSEEQILAEAFRSLALYYKDIDGPRFTPRPISPGDSPDPEEYNKNLSDISDDLVILFKELENIEQLILKNFNYFVSESNRLQRKMKSVSSRLADFSLYTDNPTKESVFFSDTFSNLDNIDFNSSVLNSTQCEINQDEGIATLPIIRSPDSIIELSKDIVINPNSNGVAGNNLEIGVVSRHSDTATMVDNNPDTWFEFERVVIPSKDDGKPLILDLTFSLHSSRIINYIRINPNNFGARTQVDITNIETSTDGLNFVSIKDEIPIPGFKTTDEPNVFTLAPSTSKFAGQGIYTFTPRFAKYIHINLAQRTPYPIQTLAGPRLRYAIGIRDIEAQALRYEDKGELVSNQYVADDEIRKIVLTASQNPSEESELVSVSHQISPDNGHVWYDIRPKEFTGFSDIVNTVPEVLEFNTNIDGSITTSNVFKSLRYKAILKRNSTAFQPNTSALRNKTKFITELHQIPISTPFLITLQHPPVQGSVKLIDSQVGARGLINRGFRVAIGTNYAQHHYLPWSKVRLDKEKYIEGGQYFIRDVAPETVTVGGKTWTKGRLSSSNSTDEVYELDYERGIFRTGDGSKGKAPETNAEITIQLTPERLYLHRVDGGFGGKLAFPSNGDKGEIIIKRYDKVTSANEPLAKGEKVFRLKNQNLISGTVKFSNSSAFANEITFFDGKTELTSTGNYSIDYESGIVYSYSNTSSTTTTTISYDYTPIHTLFQDEWTFLETTSSVKDEIMILPDGFSSIKIENEIIPSGVKKFSLSQFAIVDGTLDFVVPSGETSVFVKEVDFVDGKTELLGLVKANELVPNVLDASGLKEFDLSLTPADTDFHIVRFTNSDVFVSNVSPATPTIPGQYSLSGNHVQVYLSSSVDEPGSVTYFYVDPTKDPTGLYSVDYAMGNIYTYDPVPNGVKINYEYSRFTIEYGIARVVPIEDYVVDIQNKQITLGDREIVRKSVQAGSLVRTNMGNTTYQVLYDYVDTSRDNIDQLEPYFTPILKDYQIRVLTKSRLLP